jgi:cytochrome P450
VLTGLNQGEEEFDMPGNSSTETSEHFGIPAHVPPELVRDFNLYQFPGSDAGIHDAWKRIQDEWPEVFFTPHFGGYWVLTRADLLEAAWPDAALLSSAESVGIPPPPKEVPPLIPIDSDDPYHRQLRAPLNLALSPKAVQLLGEAARELAVSLIDALKPMGHCDFVEDFSLKMPMELFLRMVDLPSHDRERLITLAATTTHSPDMDKRGQAMKAMFGYLDGWVRKRTESPGNDLMSKIVNIHIGDRPLTHDERLGYVAMVMFGGLDTVGGTMALIAHHLATHEDDRRRLIANPATIPRAIEEFLRRYSIPTVARSLTRDTEIRGVAMKAGDRVMLPTCLHGLDERRYTNSMTVDLDRCPNDHMAFGKGTHKCPGANLARVEIKIFLEEWLARIPDFTIASGANVRYLSGGVAGIKNLPLVWPTI